MKTSTLVLLVGLCALAEGMNLEGASTTLAAKKDDDSTLLAEEPKKESKGDEAKKDEPVVKAEKKPFA